MALSDQTVQMDARTYAWNYFMVHAGQRMSVFQFFISLSTAIVGGAVLIAGSADDRKWSALLFALLPFLSFIFWRLDTRTSALIKNAETALKSLERSGGQQNDLDELALFTNDERATEGRKGGGFTGYMSYSQSFRYVFVVTALLGVAGMTITLFIPKVKKAEGALSLASNSCKTHEKHAQIDLPTEMRIKLETVAPAVSVRAQAPTVTSNSPGKSDERRSGDGK
jgi:hypothetical protein